LTGGGGVDAALECDCRECTLFPPPTFFHNKTVRSEEAEITTMRGGRPVRGRKVDRF
jgi:hypothetical protein